MKTRTDPKYLVNDCGPHLQTHSYNDCGPHFPTPSYNGPLTYS